MATVSKLHTHVALNVSAPNKIYRARHIYNELISAVTRFHDKRNKTVDGCLYVLLIIYLTANLLGHLEEYSGEQPWVKSWPLSLLENTVMEDVASPSVQASQFEYDLESAKITAYIIPNIPLSKIEVSWPTSGIGKRLVCLARSGACLIILFNNILCVHAQLSVYQ
ncbi:hypothetical protein PIB30_061494 [Stylosanthes scabra]|uniref:Uncharacterized protein n=1 Tax=Stylosanthes scabra TaxID=79078 RepID=A0ABU6RL57_9FABA|nr:hypothetical protein [Stylosanthes scabra]